MSTLTKTYRKALEGLAEDGAFLAVPEMMTETVSLCRVSGVSSISRDLYLLMRSEGHVAFEKHNLTGTRSQYLITAAGRAALEETQP